MILRLLKTRALYVDLIVLSPSLFPLNALVMFNCENRDSRRSGIARIGRIFYIGSNLIAIILLSHSYAITHFREPTIYRDYNSSEEHAARYFFLFD